MSGVLNLLLAGAASAIKDAYFNLTTLLLNTSSTNGAQNNTFLDSSSNTFTITRNGNTTQGTFTPFSQTGWSNNFNGAVTTSYLNAVSNAVFAFGTGDFTLESFIYVTAYPTSGTVAGNIICAHNWNGSGFDFTFRIGQTGLLYFENSAGNTLTASTVVALNTWAHVACVRSSGTLTFYINGVGSGSASAAGSIASTVALSIGNALNGGTYGNFNGYISNARITKGGALYTSTFTPSTTPLTTTVSAGTVSLLTCQSNRYVDNSVNAFALTAGATTSVQAFSPFAPTAAYNSAVVGGSGYFNGGSDYLTWSGSSVTTAFTFECWFYYTGTFSGIAAFVGPGTAVTNALNLYITNSTTFTFDQYGITGTNFTVPTMTANQWYHVAFVRNSSNSATVFLNGARSSTGAVTISTSFANIAAIGYVSSAVPRNWLGYLSGIKYSQSAVYSPASSTITIPTAPPDPTGSTLCMQFTNSGIYDAAAKNDLQTVDNAQVASGTYSPTATGTSGMSTIVVSSTTGLKLGQLVSGTGIGTNAVVTNIVTTTVTLSVVNSGTVSGTITFTDPTKFGTTSMYFDGAGDYLVNTSTNNPLAFGTGDFTIEFWLYLNSTGTQVIFDGRNSSSADVAPLIYYLSGLKYYTAGADRITGGTLSTGQWYYIALVKASGSTKLYINGTQTGSTYTDGNTYVQQVNRPVIGAEGVAANLGNSPLNAYIDELRITKGYARTVTSNPTAAFPVQ